MASIVELYRQHKDLLSPYFKSEQEAADCERRAEMGDDRAMRVLSLVYDIKVPEDCVFRVADGSVSEGVETVRTEYVRDGKEDKALGTLNDGKRVDREKGLYNTQQYRRLDPENRKHYNYFARRVRNFDALPFAESVMFGNRSILTACPEYRHQYPGWHSLDKGPYLHESPQYQGYISLSPTGSLRYEVAKRYVTNNYGNHELPRIDGQLYNTQSDSFFHVLYDPADKDKFIDSDWERYHHLDPKKAVFTESKLNALITCALAGSAESAHLLSEVFAHPKFYERHKYIRSEGFFGFGPPIYEAEKNPVHSNDKAKEWHLIAEHLEGKTTLIEREKFLKEFLYSQDKTTEGLYNIGYALCHNKHIGDFNRGIDYLKHAANLGDANAARELGEQYQTCAEANQNNPDQMKFAHFWYKIAASNPMQANGSDGKVVSYNGHPNAKARVAYLDNAFPELKYAKMNETELRNPSREHIRQYPASMWAAEIPIAHVSSIVSNPIHDGVTTRMEGDGRGK